MPAKKSAQWTKAQDAILKRDYGKLTVTEIAKAMRKGRGAIVGRAFRLGLSKKFKPKWPTQRLAPSPPKRSIMPKPFNPPMSEKKQPTVLPLDAFAPLPGKTPVPFLHLKDRHCRWPVTGGFCGCRKLESRPYCALHNKIASVGLASVVRQRIPSTAAGSPD